MNPMSGHRRAKCGALIKGNHVNLAKHQMVCDNCGKLFSKQWNTIAGVESTNVDNSLERDGVADKARIN